MIASMEPSGRWWLVDGHEVDLTAPIGTYPRNVRVAVLAKRDADTPDGEDLAALLEWTLEEHPPWTGACGVCGPDCGAHDIVTGLAGEWLGRRAQELVRRAHAQLDEIEARRRQ